MEEQQTRNDHIVVRYMKAKECQRKELGKAMYELYGFSALQIILFCWLHEKPNSTPVDIARTIGVHPVLIQTIAHKFAQKTESRPAYVCFRGDNLSSMVPLELTEEGKIFFKEIGSKGYDL